MTKKVDGKKVGAKIPSVALQQRSENGARRFAKLTPNELHQQTLNAREAFLKICVGAETYAVDVLLPYCEEIIARYRMPGVAAKDRPNGKPTVEAYFRGIKMNYSTVRSWIHRKRMSTEMFDPDKTASHNENGKVPHLTELEARLIGTASAGDNLVKAFQQGGNVDEAIKEFTEHAPTPERILEFIERPVKVAATEVEKLAVQLCKLIDRDDNKKRTEDSLSRSGTADQSGTHHRGAGARRSTQAPAGGIVASGLALIHRNDERPTTQSSPGRVRFWDRQRPRMTQCTPISAMLCSASMPSNATCHQLAIRSKPDR
jgi:hypothetical protein